VAFERLGVSYVPKEVNVFEPSPEFLAANPLATVPVLLIEGEPLVDSATILEVLHEGFGERVWPSDLEFRRRVRAASTLAEGVMSETVRWFLEGQRASPSGEWTAEYLENLERTLGVIAGMAPGSSPWIGLNQELTQAGYDLVVALEYLELRLKGFDWKARFPSLERFLSAHRGRPEVAASRPPV